ncbi:MULTISPECIES: FAD-dependent oxidoreductase [Halolamina]|uniref:Glycerol-3-phosphate dehydrogenase n=1 Tax=Halolamina pelagica TaxID=699431 RepID=A0A1I5MIK6_9EURY|nr:MULTISPECIES: glycerol-3-phosphate dehydrogenase/oxidase [Halolamina]NHX36044.1 FAD-dependent oxidoreductase [Halolamina sp. R1-12]SFP09415.1 glycerol-3-phosphate dehydrogenase [Halolamina pelagica]
MTVKTEVAVIGGGATGVGVARDLAMRGVDVTLLERGAGLNAGTSGRSHGVLHSGARYAESDPEGAADCLQENRILREIAPASIDDAGGLFVRLADDDPDYFRRKLDACREVGMEPTLLDAQELRERVPDIAEGVERGFAVPDGVVSPARLVAATAASAREHGASIHTDARVADIDAGTGSSKRLTVRVDDGPTIAADAVVNAAGPWAGEVAAMAGAELGMRPTRGVMVAVDYADLGPVLNRCREPADGDIVVPHGEQVVLGTTSVAVDDPDEFERADWEVDRTVEECAAMLPALADAAIERTYWGLRPLYEPDELDRGGRGISRDFALVGHDAAPGLVSVVGGKLTTYRRMAEAVADRVCGDLGVDDPCRTAAEPLPGADEPERLDELVREFGAVGPADSDVVR